jgi:hypothetical protein
VRVRAVADGAVADGEIVGRYLQLGLAVGRHIDGLVDAYYGPPALAERATASAPSDPASLVAQGRALVADIDAGSLLDGIDSGEGASSAAGGPRRRRWIRAQTVGLLTTARRLAGEPIAYADEVEQCYGVRPQPVSEDELAVAHQQLDDALPGAGALRERLIAWREAHAVPPEHLEAVIDSLLDDFRDRTRRLFGLPEGEQVQFELVQDKPWSGFNFYRGDLRSTVAVNTDLPVLSTSIAHLVAHEAYPGHHTEHCRKEVGLVRRRRWLEETIFLVGTPQCLVAEGLADLGLEVIVGRRPEPVVAEHLHPLGVRYDTEIVAAVADAGEALGAVRANAAWRLHAEGADADEVVDDVARWGLLPRERAVKAVEFLLHPTWRAYVTCYVDGLRLCRRYVAGDPARFAELVTEQLVPADLAASAR